MKRQELPEYCKTFYDIFVMKFMTKSKKSLIFGLGLSVNFRKVVRREERFFALCASLGLLVRFVKLTANMAFFNNNFVAFYWSF